MARKTSDHNNQPSNAQTPKPESGNGWWRSPYNPLRLAYWVDMLTDVFKSNDWFLKLYFILFIPSVVTYIAFSIVHFIRYLLGY